MANPLKPNPLIAVDTNIPLDLAEKKEHPAAALAVGDQHGLINKHQGLSATILPLTTT